LSLPINGIQLHAARELAIARVSRTLESESDFFIN
jgi:hypothetical protein